MQRGAAGERSRSVQSKRAAGDDCRAGVAVGAPKNRGASASRSQTGRAAQLGNDFGRVAEDKASARLRERRRGTGTGCKVSAIEGHRAGARYVCAHIEMCSPADRDRCGSIAQSVGRGSDDTATGDRRSPAVAVAAAQGQCAGGRFGQRSATADSAGKSVATGSFVHRQRPSSARHRSRPRQSRNGDIVAGEGTSGRRKSGTRVHLQGGASGKRARSVQSERATADHGCSRVAVASTQGQRAIGRLGQGTAATDRTGQSLVGRGCNGERGRVGRQRDRTAVSATSQSPRVAQLDRAVADGGRTRVSAGAGQHHGARTGLEQCGGSAPEHRGVGLHPRGDIEVVAGDIKGDETESCRALRAAELP